MLARVHRTRRERLKKEKSLKIVAKQINKIIFRGVRWVCGGIYVIVIHRGYTAGGVILEKNGLAVDI